MIDAHAHIHEADFPFEWAEVLQNAQDAGINQIITVGTSVKDSRLAAKFAEQHDEVFALVGIHPGEVIDGGLAELREIIEKSPKIVGFGDVGLDYHYENSQNTPQEQKELLKKILSLALERNLPVSFHVRDAFDDFWSIFDEFKGRIRGVLHSFTGSEDDLAKALQRGLFIGVNGIVTFAGDVREVIRKCPLKSIILETDAPFLAPAKLRGQQNQPANVAEVARFLARLYKVEVSVVDEITSKNTKELFKI
ncbi:TatD family hydrolase [Candidatus Saccharibacteria bacterium]|nr:TatD family hydrolase [Candidatus Saccharibacteria bacterium]